MTDQHSLSLAEPEPEQEPRETKQIEIPETALVVDPIRPAGPAYIDLAGERVAQQGLNLLIVGYRGSGKSYLLWYLCEQLWRLRLPFIALDPAGTGRGLLELPEGISPWAEAGEGHIRALVEGGESFYANLSTLPDEAAPITLIRWIEAYLSYVRTGAVYPCALVLDDLARFAPNKGGSDEFKQAATDLSHLIQEARQWGLYILATAQRLPLTRPEVTTQMNLWFFGNPGSTSDYKKSLSHLPAWFEESNWNQRMLSSLKAGQFLMMSQAGTGLVQIPRRKTPDYGQTPTLRDRPGRRGLRTL